MLNTDDSWLNPSKRAKKYLDKALEGETLPEEDLVVLDSKLNEKKLGQVDIREALNVPDQTKRQPVVKKETISASEARGEAPVLTYTSDRQSVRLLLFTKDTTILEETSLSYQQISGVRDMFLEVHVVVLNDKTNTEEVPVLRPFENVWFYQTNSSSWWKRPFDAFRVAETQLVFSGGFRADVIVAEDLFEAGLAGWFLSKKHERPFQIHVYEDFFDESFIEGQEHPILYEWAVRYLLRRVQSVRTKTEFQRQAIIEENKDLEPFTEVLPSYYNLEVWRDFVPTFTLHERYPQFKFIMLHVSSMNTSSHSMEVMEGASRILRRYPTTGLIMVGNGPLRPKLERQAIALGLQKQIEFEPMPTEVVSYMKSANVLIHLSEDGSEDDILLEGAVSKVPLIANSAGLAGKLFVDGESACLCAPTDTRCVSDSINRYLNENQERASFAIAASEIVFERIEQDYGAYLESYRDSIERCMVAEEV